MSDKVIRSSFNLVIGENGKTVIIKKKRKIITVDVPKKENPKILVGCQSVDEGKINKKGRKKKKNLVKIARGIECSGEFCYKCDRLRRVIDNPLQPYLWCVEFERELAPAFNDSIAERCGDCHMAARYAKGSNIYI